jgi:hypothetical protein
MRRRWGSHLGLPRTAETTGKRCTATAGLPRALAAALAHGGGTSALGKASTGAASLSESLGVVGSAQGGLHIDAATG